MKILSLFVILMFYTCYAVGLGVDRQAIYTYSNIHPAGERMIIGSETIASMRIDLKKSGRSHGRAAIFWRGHAGVGSKICDIKSVYYCLFNPALTFSVPKGTIKIGESWIFNELSFKVTEKIELTVFGKKVPVFIISSNLKSKHKAYFLYSESSGLMGMSFSPIGDNYYFYFLEGDVGFPF